jgi:hypothetical protein
MMSRRAWRRGVYVLLTGALLLSLALFRTPLLRGAAGLLIAGGQESASPWLVVMDSGLDPDLVASLFREGAPPRVVLIEPAPDRLQALGILPPPTDLEKGALERRGVPPPSIDVLPGLARDDWDRARALRDWLQDRPGAHADVLCKRFGSRRMRIILGRVLGAAAARVRVVALADRRYDETDWWQSKKGVDDCWHGFVGLTYVWLAGEGDKSGPAWDPDAYERALP